MEEFRRKYISLNIKQEYDFTIVYNQVNSRNREQYYKKLSHTFFQKIDTNKYPQTLLRPRGYTRKIDNSAELSFLTLQNGITVDKGMDPMAKIVKNSRCVIQLNHPSTNFLECLYVNHPIVVILTNSQATDIVLPYYQFFLDEKVMHPNIDSMISHLNSVNLEDWWNDVIQKKLYLKFKEKFARKT